MIICIFIENYDKELIFKKKGFFEIHKIRTLYT